MMRTLIILLLLVLRTPVCSQPVLAITDARRANLVATHLYFLEDFTHKYTYNQVSGMPQDSFRTLQAHGPSGYRNQPGTIWLRFSIKNQTNAELFLLSFQRNYTRLDVYVSDENGKLTQHQAGNKIPFDYRLAPTAHPIVSLGQHPRLVYIALYPDEIFRDSLRISDIGHAILERKQMGFWQGMVLGAYLLLILYAFVFWFRLRDPLFCWFALFLLTNTHWFLHRSGYFEEFLGIDSLYTQYEHYYPIRFIFTLFWSIFHIKFLQLKRYSKLLYYPLVTWLGLGCINYTIDAITTAYGLPFAPLDSLLSQVGIDWAGKLIITLSMLLISLVYVGIKKFYEVRWFALAFSFGLTSMLISLLALYNSDWLPFYPYNYLFVVGSLLEMIIMAYALAEQYRRKQNKMQQQVILQLQENLDQKNKLLQIRDEIARDLHDEVGATLTSIAISTKLVQKKIGPERTEITLILEQIQTDSQDTITTIRDTVWALNPDNDAPEKFIERLRAVAYQLLANQDSTLTFETSLAPDELPPFSMEQRRNIYFVFKESLHNIVKHAQATSVAVRIFRQSNELHIRISDNGSGFEPTQPGEGNGLINFQKRAGEGGFSVDICSEPGRGTTVQMQIPVQKTTTIGDGAEH